MTSPFHVLPLVRASAFGPRALALIVAATFMGTASAQVAYVDTQGREWRQVEGLTGHTWLEIAAQCPTDGATPCRGLLGNDDVTGWVWATTEQVTELLAEWVPEIVDNPTLGGPNYAAVAMFFFGYFAPTYEFYTTIGGYNYVSGWTADESDGIAGLAEVAAQWNPFGSTFNVAGAASVTSASGVRGAWLVKIPATECAADLDGNGTVGGDDLGLLLNQWGRKGEQAGAADLNDDGIVDGADLGLLLAVWGSC